jgi:hypothetical protein
LLLTDCTDPSLENLERLLSLDLGDETDRFRALLADDRSVMSRHILPPVQDVAFGFATNY